LVIGRLRRQLSLADGRCCTGTSGTSAGAINAAIVASAIAEGKPAEARTRLRSFWLTVAKPGVADFGRELWGPLERHWRETIGTWLVANAAVSPYQANPLGLNPLRDAIAAHVDLDAIRSQSAPPLYVTLTNVKSGLPRIISNDTMTIDALLASARLPQLFQAVEIDGEPYWDGGYSGNPTLWPMIQGGPARDLIVVQLTPDAAAEVPTDAAAIRRRVSEIVFHSSLVAEMQAITALRAVAAQGDATARVLDLRLHRIGPPRGRLFEEGTALERSRARIDRLYVEGRHAARRFLARHGRDIGVRETLDIAKVFSGERKPKLRLPANEAAFDPQPAPVLKSAPARAAGGGHA
jgi:NTE family protein